MDFKCLQKKLVKINLYYLFVLFLKKLGINSPPFLEPDLLYRHFLACLIGLFKKN